MNEKKADWTEDEKGTEMITEHITKNVTKIIEN
jgi:hypothetical protein